MKAPRPCSTAAQTRRRASSFRLAADQGDKRADRLGLLAALARHLFLAQDGLVEGLGLLLGVDAELALQQVAQLLVLGEGAPAPAGEGVELHEVAVGLLGERVDAEQPLGVLDGDAVAAALAVLGDQRAQRLHHRLAQALLLLLEPALELLAVAHGTAGEQLAAVELDGARQGERIDMLVAETEAQTLLEGFEVDPELGAGVEGDRLVGGEERLPGRGRVSRSAAGERRAQVVERLAQAAPGVGRFVLRPEQAGEALAGVRRAAAGRQVGEQAAHLLRLEAEQRAVVDAHLEAAEQADLHPRPLGSGGRYTGILGSARGAFRSRHDFVNPGTVYSNRAKPAPRPLTGICRLPTLLAVNGDEC